MILNTYNDKIFVFGSNLAGKHGKGAAQLAKSFFGATYGVGDGLSGKSYAIPTKDEHIQTLPLSTIQSHIDEFIDFAIYHDTKKFMVTRIGCGLAGYKDVEVAELFYNSITKKNIEKPQNILLPFLWEKSFFGQHEKNIKIIVAGGREFNDYTFLQTKLDILIKNIKQNNNITIVSGGAKGADTLGEKYAIDNNLQLEIYKADWDCHKKVAGPIRNHYMSWASSHLVAFWDGQSSGTKDMINTATNDGLITRVIKYTPTSTQIHKSTNRL